MSAVTPDREKAIAALNANRTDDWESSPHDDPRKVAHIECDCVPDLGPSHCHLCSDRAERPMSWADAHPRVPVVDREALARRLWLSRVTDRAADTAPEIAALCDDAADALIASGIFQDAAVFRASVEAEQRERDAQIAREHFAPRYVIAAIRAGGTHERTEARS